jgi:hypothetical protein
MIKVDPKLFYMSGVICFGLVAICGLINYFVYFNQYNLFSKVSSLASVVFNFFLTGFFYYLLKTQVSSLPADNTNLSEALEEFNKNVK